MAIDERAERKPEAETPREAAAWTAAFALLAAMIGLSVWGASVIPASARVPIHFHPFRSPRARRRLRQPLGGTAGVAAGRGGDTPGPVRLPKVGAQLAARSCRHGRGCDRIQAALHLLLLPGASGRKVDVGLAAAIAEAMLMMVIGNHLPTTRRNGLIGIRTLWTMTRTRCGGAPTRWAGACSSRSASRCCAQPWSPATPPGSAIGRSRRGGAGNGVLLVPAVAKGRRCALLSAAWWRRCSELPRETGRKPFRACGRARTMSRLKSAPRLHRERLRIQTPCRERWEDMAGDDQVCHCGRCDKHVYNLSAMTTEAASALRLRKRFGLCVRYATRPRHDRERVVPQPATARKHRGGSDGCRYPAGRQRLRHRAERASCGPRWRPSGSAWTRRARRARPRTNAKSARRSRHARSRSVTSCRMNPAPPNIEYTMGGPWGHETARPPLKRAGRIARPSLTGRQLAQVVVEGKPALERCCDRRPAASELRKLTLKVRVRARGSVEQVSVVAASEPGFERCVTVSIKRWRFPSADAASEFEFPMVCGPTRS